jgi:hypothetical protein
MFFHIMNTKRSSKKHLSAEGLLSATRKVFNSVKDPEKDSRGKKSKIPLVDCLMSGLAVFGLKFPSLLQFSNDREDEITKHNLKTLYKVAHAPCDTYMRERLDEVDPKEIRKTFTTIFAMAQRDKILEDYEYLDGHYLLLNDGTSVFESNCVHCQNCCVKKHKKKGIIHTFTFHNGIPLNDTYPDLLVNLLICKETLANGTTKTFTWITDIEITQSNVYELMRGGRTRWKIENETFNTLKNQGYQFEHNFGHGDKNLNVVFAMLMFLAFAIDQLQQISCVFFQAALKKMHTRARLWRKIQSRFETYYINSWQDLFEAIAFGHKGTILIPDTS